MDWVIFDVKNLRCITDRTIFVKEDETMRLSAGSVKQIGVSQSRVDQEGISFRDCIGQLKSVLNDY
jgi:hypothetical protein